MKAKDKAKELVERFKKDTIIFTWDGDGYKVDQETSLGNAKNCALICVEELLSCIDERREGHSYWQEVKQEIEKL